MYYYNISLTCSLTKEIEYTEMFIPEINKGSKQGKCANKQRTNFSTNFMFS